MGGMTAPASSSPTPPEHSQGATAATPGASPTNEGAAPPAKPRGLGNWRSLLLSTAAVLALLFVIYAIVPRPESVTQPPVDVVPVAQQMQQAGTTVWLPQLGEPGKPWKATSVRHGEQPPSFYAGYTRTDNETTFVAVQEIPTKTPAAQADPWRVEALSNGREDGESTIAGTTWKRYTTGGDPTRHGLLGTRGDMTVVVSELADYATLEAVAASLQPYGK